MSMAASYGTVTTALTNWLDISGNNRNATAALVGSITLATSNSPCRASIAPADTMLYLITHEAALSQISSMSIEVWVKPVYSDGFDNIIVGKNGTANGEWKLTQTNTGDGGNQNYTLTVYTDSTHYIKQQTSNYTPASNNWHYVVATFNDTSDSMKMYVNGTQATVTETNNGFSNMRATSSDIAIFSSALCLLPSRGYIAQFRLWNRILSATEVQALWEDDKWKYGY
jgi:hypothetical protein